ncbi:MAG TPA: alpha/beta hydrolase [Clostridiales bacterium]|nr:alpha/beta hydrolase [Clostridiales bacterium]
MLQKNIQKKIESLKNSVFIVNKLYLWVLFLLLAVTDWSLAFYSFLSYIVIYLWNIFTARLPIENKGEFQYITKVYKTIEDSELKMDIWYPNQEKGKGDYPLVLFAHGGGWVSGFRNQPNNISWCRYLAANGFVAASIDYRFGIKNDMEDILSDYDNALSYLKSHAKELRICPHKIILMGLSAGGHLSLLYSSHYSNRRDKGRMKGICGVVAYYAPSDLTDLFSPESRSLFARLATIQTLKGKPDSTLKGKPDKAFKGKYNKILKENLDGKLKRNLNRKSNEKLDQQKNYEYYSPIMWISKRMPKVFLAHGKNDRTVPFSSSVKMAGKLEEFRVSYKLMAHPKGDHCFEMNSKDLQTIRILRMTISWMREVIGEE